MHIYTLIDVDVLPCFNSQPQSIIEQLSISPARMYCCTKSMT
jgi:hypothetical protein